MIGASEWLDSWEARSIIQAWRHLCSMGRVSVRFLWHNEGAVVYVDDSYGHSITYDIRSALPAERSSEIDRFLALQTGFEITELRMLFLRELLIAINDEAVG